MSTPIELHRGKFIEHTVPRILAAVNRGREGRDTWAREDDGTWRSGSKTAFFGYPPATIDHAIKPEYIIANLKKTRGKAFAEPGVGWGYNRGGRWVAETWDGRTATFRHKARARDWLAAQGAPSGAGK